jgi:hypothetical protein
MRDPPHSDATRLPPTRCELHVCFHRVDLSIVRPPRFIRPSRSPLFIHFVFPGCFLCPSSSFLQIPSSPRHHASSLISSISLCRVATKDGSYRSEGSLSRFIPSKDQGPIC